MLKTCVCAFLMRFLIFNSDLSYIASHTIATLYNKFDFNVPLEDGSSNTTIKVYCEYVLYSIINFQNIVKYHLRKVTLISQPSSVFSYSRIMYFTRLEPVSHPGLVDLSLLCKQKDYGKGPK